MNKWVATIRIDGKQHFIGVYENEEEAAVDYARAVRVRELRLTHLLRPSLHSLAD